MWRTQHYADQDYIWPESSQTFSCNYDSLDYIVWEILCGKMDNKEGRGSPATDTGGPAVRKHVSVYVNTTLTMFEGDRLLWLLILLSDHTLLQTQNMLQFK